MTEHATSSTSRRGHAVCPFGDGWRSTSWETNQDRAVAMEQWREHKKLHNRYGPVFVEEKVCICRPSSPNSSTVTTGCPVHDIYRAMNNA